MSRRQRSPLISVDWLRVSASPLRWQRWEALCLVTCVQMLLIVPIAGVAVGMTSSQGRVGWAVTFALLGVAALMLADAARRWGARCRDAGSSTEPMVTVTLVGRPSAPL